MKGITMLRIVRKWWWVSLVVLALGVAGFVIWASTPAQPLPEALAALESDEQVRVTVDDWLVFAPEGATPTTGFIFYPGGRVDPRAYAPALRDVAAQGYLAVIVPMPLNLAVLAPGRAGDVIAAFPEITTWVIGGHSLGGAMAANYVRGASKAVRGLVLWAAYPAGIDDLSGQALAVASIYGTLDGLATPEKIEASRPLLPATTRYVPIEGGNHAQFGWYGPQAGDNPATISRADQQAQVVAATVALLAAAGAG
ncbi:MAG: hypothetical protein Kow0077_32930 [Anaerolineae bacterium]